MLITKAIESHEHIYMIFIETMEEYKYLGAITNENNECSEEIKTRIAQASVIFMKMKRVVCSSDPSFKLNITLARCYVLSVLFYRVEKWTLNKLDNRKFYFHRLPHTQKHAC